ncbi:hypothetical protein PVK73_19035 [Bacillus thuringiensis]
MAFINIKDYCDKYLNAQIKNIKGSSPSSIIYNPDYIYSETVKGIPSNIPIHSPANLSDKQGPFPIENTTDEPADRDINISDPRQTTVTTETKNSVSIGASAEQKLELHFGIDGTLSGGFGAGAKYTLDVSTKASTELSSDKSISTTIKTGVPDQTYVKTIPPGYIGTYTIQFYRTQPTTSSNGWSVVLVGGLSRIGVNVAKGPTNVDATKARNYTQVIAYKTFKDSTGTSNTIVMTADELALSVTGYSKPSGVTGNSTQKSLTAPLLIDMTIDDQATFVVVFDPPITKVAAADDSTPSKFMDVYFPGENGNLEYYDSVKVDPDFDIENDDLDIDNDADPTESITRTIFYD